MSGGPNAIRGVLTSTVASNEEEEGYDHPGNTDIDAPSAPRLLFFRRPSIRFVVQIMSAIVRDNSAAAWAPGAGWTRGDYAEAVAVAMELDLVAPVMPPPPHSSDANGMAGDEGNVSDEDGGEGRGHDLCTDDDGVDGSGGDDRGKDAKASTGGVDQFVPLFEVHSGSGYITTWGPASKALALSLGGAAVREIGPQGATRAAKMTEAIALHMGSMHHNTSFAAEGAQHCLLPPHLLSLASKARERRRRRKEAGENKDTTAGTEDGDGSTSSAVWDTWPSLIVLGRRSSGKAGVGDLRRNASYTVPFEKGGDASQLAAELVCASSYCATRPGEVPTPSVVDTNEEGGTKEGRGATTSDGNVGEAGGADGGQSPSSQNMPPSSNTYPPPYDAWDSHIGRTNAREKWRARLGVLPESPFGAARYRRLQERSARTWAAGVVDPAHRIQRVRDVQTRMVLDDMMTEEECYELRESVRDHVKGGASYTGGMLELALKSRMGAASWQDAKVSSNIAA